MDPSLALIVGAFIGAVAGVGGAWLTNRANATQQREEREHARQLERDRWEREDRIRREDRSRADRERWLAVKREVAVRLLRHCDVLEQSRHGATVKSLAAASVTEAIVEGNLAFDELRIVAPELTHQAGKLYRAAAELFFAASRGVDSNSPEGEQLSEQYNLACGEFLGAAHAAVGSVSLEG